MKLQHTIILGALILFFASCQSLSKKKAKQVITKELHFPKIIDYPIPKEYTTDENTDGLGVTIILDEEEFKKKVELLKKFEERKLIIFTKTREQEEVQHFLGTSIRSWTKVQISLTDEGKKYLVKDSGEFFFVKLWEEDILEVIRIKRHKGLKSTFVTFGVGNTNITPFGDYFPNKNGKSNRVETLKKESGRWRIKGRMVESFSP